MEPPGCSPPLLNLPMLLVGSTYSKCHTIKWVHVYNKNKTKNPDFYVIFCTFFYFCIKSFIFAIVINVLILMLTHLVLDALHVSSSISKMGGF